MHCCVYPVKCISFFGLFLGSLPWELAETWNEAFPGGFYEGNRLGCNAKAQGETLPHTFSVQVSWTPGGFIMAGELQYFSVHKEKNKGSQKKNFGDKWTEKISISSEPMLDWQLNPVLKITWAKSLSQIKWEWTWKWLRKVLWLKLSAISNFLIGFFLFFLGLHA